MADRVQVPVYFPPDLYRWLVEQKAAGHGSLSQQVVNYCYEARVRGELAAAAADINPDQAAALDRIRGRIEQGPGA